MREEVTKESLVVTSVREYSISLRVSSSKGEIERAQVMGESERAPVRESK